MSIGFQVIFRAADDQVLAPSMDKRRVLVEILHRVGRERGLFGFGVADTHGHADLLGGLDVVGKFIHDLRVGVHWNLGISLRRPEVWPIRDVWHAGNLLDYSHRQTEHHGVDVDPFREGTSLPDLMGLRVTAPWLAERVAAHLPRYEGPIRPLAWGEDPFGRAVRLEQVGDAAAAAFNLGDLRGRCTEIVQARRAAVHVAAGLDGCGPAAIAAALGISKRAFFDIRLQPCDAVAVAAVRRQASLRSCVTPVRPLLVLRDGDSWSYKADLVGLN